MASATGSGALSLTGDMYIARDQSGVNEWDGKIDGVRLYGRTLTPTEILARYNNNN